MANERKSVNPFQEGLYVGLGLALRTKEMVEEFAQKIIHQYEMNEDEGKRFVDDLLHESQETRTRVDEMIETRIDKYFKDLDLVRKDDLDRLVKKMNELEKKLGKN
ncbi:phasin family protein [Salinispira pacifica]